MNRDELEGKAKIVEGKLRQGAGDLLDDPDLKDEGIAEEELPPDLQYSADSSVSFPTNI